jgi:integrase
MVTSVLARNMPDHLKSIKAHCLHNCRSTKAEQLMNCGIHLMQIKKFLGHAAEVTSRYTVGLNDYGDTVKDVSKKLRESQPEPYYFPKKSD